MAGTKQFYMKFHVKDFRTDPKVCECNAGSVGVYIMLMCLLFDTETKGKHRLNSECLQQFDEILPRQNSQQINQQTSQQLLDICRCVAEHLAKHLPFTEKEVREGLHELLVNNVLYLEGNFLCQKRMIKDAKISEIRASSGKKGADATNKKNKKSDGGGGKKSSKKEDLPTDLPRQNNQQKSNYDYNSNSNSNFQDNEGVIGNEYGGVGVKKFGGEEEPGKPGDYEGKWYIQIPLSFCKHFYFSHQAFGQPRDGALRVLANYFRSDDMVIMTERLELWADEFNEFLERTEEKAPNGKAVKIMQGKEGWPNHFHNWLISQKDRLRAIPDKRIDNQSVNGSTKQTSLISGTSSVDEQEDFYRRKS